MERKSKPCPMGKYGSEFDGVCRNCKKVVEGVDCVLRGLDLALNDSLLAWFGAVRMSKVRDAHSGEKQTECNQEGYKKQGSSR